MAFKIDPEKHAKLLEQIGITRAEMERLHGLPDRFLGRALLKIGREARDAVPDALGNPSAGGYGVMLTWGVIPRLAARLGETDLMPAETAFARSLATDGPGFREVVGQCMANHELQKIKSGKVSQSFRLLNHDFVNGNPITITLDRVHPPTQESNDWIARHMREISRARFGHEEHVAWSPAFQDYKDRNLSFFRQVSKANDPYDGPEM